jgi:hypothetical protein
MAEDLEVEADRLSASRGKPFALGFGDAPTMLR